MKHLILLSTLLISSLALANPQSAVTYSCPTAIPSSFVSGRAITVDDQSWIIKMDGWNTMYALETRTAEDGNPSYTDHQAFHNSIECDGTMKIGGISYGFRIWNYYNPDLTCKAAPNNTFTCIAIAD